MITTSKPLRILLIASTFLTSSVPAYAMHSGPEDLKDTANKQPGQNNPPPQQLLQAQETLLQEQEITVRWDAMAQLEQIEHAHKSMTEAYTLISSPSFLNEFEGFLDSNLKGLNQNFSLRNNEETYRALMIGFINMVHTSLPHFSTIMREGYTEITDSYNRFMQIPQLERQPLETMFQESVAYYKDLREKVHAQYMIFVERLWVASNKPPEPIGIIQLKTIFSSAQNLWEQQLGQLSMKDLEVLYNERMSLEIEQFKVLQLHIVNRLRRQHAEQTPQPQQRPPLQQPTQIIQQQRLNDDPCFSSHEAASTASFERLITLTEATVTDLPHAAIVGIIQNRHSVVLSQPVREALARRAQTIKDREEGGLTDAYLLAFTAVNPPYLERPHTPPSIRTLSLTQPIATQQQRPKTMIRTFSSN